MPTGYIQGRTARTALYHPDNQQILIIETERRSGFTWELPGGKVDRNETIKQAALRELWEETRLHAQLSLVRYARRAIPLDPNVFWEYYMFSGMYCGDTIKLESSEATYQWCPLREALHNCTDWWSKHYLFSKLSQKAI